jgi:4-hydroxy-2-oxoheptanedioate aldolase
LTAPWTTLRQRLAQGRVVGTFLKLPAVETVELAAERLDFAVVDLEHSQLDELEARRLVRHAHAIGFPALVRLPAPGRDRVNRILEAGAAGIQVPTVRSAATVSDTRAAMRYAPQGNRSISLAQAPAGYGAVGLRKFLDDQDPGPLLVAQIETAATDDSLEQIAAAGPDVLFVGPLDLRVELDLDDERVRERIAEIERTAAAAGIVLGGAGIDNDAVRYDVVGSDVALLRESLAGVAEAERKRHARD